MSADEPIGPPLQPRRELRFAIVMYGGVSLSIYMNGVAQELYHLVRSTAAVGTDADANPVALHENRLSGTEIAYRRLAQSITSRSDGFAAGPADPANLGEGSEILARFVVDVLSGSSAGGINAVFLAKALANDQRMSGLTDLWLDEGDIGKLLNDGSPMSGLPRERPPESLLNSGRMYADLLKAFDGMEESNPTSEGTKASPFVKELDLFVTTTDLHGLLLPIRFENGVTMEPRYRNVFQFRYRNNGGRISSDFGRDVDPFLAFACRCTSAFPIAFKPMMLSDIADGVSRFSRYNHLGVDEGSWGRFYDAYLPRPGGGPAPGSLPFAQRPFADGGALDNKPFGHAIDTLFSRHSDDVPIDRKLIFVEPDPSTQIVVKEGSGRPDVLRNLLDQTALLPRQEVVRDDLRRIDDMNRVVRRINMALRAVQDAMSREVEGSADTPLFVVAEPDDGTLRRATNQQLDTPMDDASRRTFCYEAYRELRKDAAVEDLAGFFAQLLHVDGDSDYAVAIRALIRSWLDSHFGAPATDGRRTIDRFLKAFDGGYRLRRSAFVESRLDALYLLKDGNNGAQALLRGAGSHLQLGDATAVVLRQAVARLRIGVAAARHEVRSVVDGPPDDLASAVISSGIRVADLERILHHRTDEGRRDEAISTYEGNAEALDRLMQMIEDMRGGAWERSHKAVDIALAAAASLGPTGVETARVFRLAYENFERFDTVAFPLGYGAVLGEGDNVEVIRISPLDARALTPSRGEGKKVTGAGYMHFGAFLDRSWRENDIMWGRLDAAEVLIEALVPQVDVDNPSAVSAEQEGRSALVAHLRDLAHCAILREELKREDLAMLLQASQRPELLAGVDQRIRDLIDSAGRCGELLEEFKGSYERPKELDPRTTYQTIGRGSHILGQMFRTVAMDNGVDKLGWAFSTVSRVGQFFTGMVEAAVPGSFAHLLAKHWFVLLYLFEILAIVGGAVLSSPAAQRFGTLALLITIAANAGIWIISRRLHGSKPKKGLFLGKVLLALLLVGVGWLAYLELQHLGEGHPSIPVIGHEAPPAPNGS